MRFRAVILAALAWPVSGLAGEGGEAQSMDGYFRGWADIDASGRLQSFSPDGKAHPSIAEALRKELQGVAFTPARTDVGPVAIRTYLLATAMRCN